MQLLVIGVDAMCPQRVLKEGPAVGNLHRLWSHGSLFDIQMGDDPCTPEVWTSFATGLSRSDHCVRGLTVDDSGQLWEADDLPPAHLPDRILNSQGITTGLFNIPVVTYPPRPTAGWMTCGDMLYPQRVYPKNLAQRLAPYPPSSCDYHYPEGVSISEPMVRRKHECIFEEFTRRGQISFNNLVALLEWVEPEVVVAYWHFLDSIQHHLLCQEEKVSAAYRLVDSFVGELTERFSPENMVVVSDHGMRAVSEDDEGEGLMRVGEWELLQMHWHGHRWLSSGVHSNRALCIASWPSRRQGRPETIEQVLPWALNHCGIDWRPAPTGALATGQSKQLSPPHRRRILRRLRDLGYG